MLLIEHLLLLPTIANKSPNDKNPNSHGHTTYAFKVHKRDSISTRNKIIRLQETHQTQYSQHSYVRPAQRSRSLSAEQVNRRRIACCGFNPTLKLHTATVPPLMRQPQRRKSARLRLQLATSIESTRRKRKQIS